MVDGGEQDGGIHVHVISLKAFGDVHADAVAQFVLGGVERESSGSLPRRSLPGLAVPGPLAGACELALAGGFCAPGAGACCACAEDQESAPVATIDSTKIDSFCIRIFSHWLIPLASETGSSVSSKSEGRGISKARVHQGCDLRKGMDAAACADARAVERGGSASEVEPLLQGPALQKRVDKAGVEEVAGAGGVDGVHMKRGSVVELRAVPGEYAVDAECGGGGAAAEATREGGGGGFEKVGGHKLAGETTAADQIVDIFKQRFDAGIEVIQVGDDPNFRGARPSGGLGGSRGVVAVKVKRSEEHTSELQSRLHLVCRLLLEKKKQ